MARLRPKNWRDFQHYTDRAPPWIKLHKRLLDDREFYALSPLAAKTLILVWLLASEGDGGVFDFDTAKIAFRLRMRERDAKSAMDELVAAQFLVEANDADGGAGERQSTAQQKRTDAGWGSRHISDVVKRSVWARDKGKCVLCGSTERIEYDHKIPVSRGGSSTVDNVQLLCRPCNRAKRTKTAEHVAAHAEHDAASVTPEREGETQVQRERERQIPRASRFGEFWAVYPRKVGKTKAQQAFDKIVAKENPDLLIAAAGRYASKQAGTEEKYIAHATTWLNGRRWEDEDTAANVIRPTAFNSPEELEGQRLARERIYGQAQN